jgi:hypothetical protein
MHARILYAIGQYVLFRAITDMMRPQPDASNWRNLAVATRSVAVASQCSRSSQIVSNETLG